MILIEPRSYNPDAGADSRRREPEDRREDKRPVSVNRTYPTGGVNGGGSTRPGGGRVDDGGGRVINGVQFRGKRKTANQFRRRRMIKNLQGRGLPLAAARKLAPPLMTFAAAVKQFRAKPSQQRRQRAMQAYRALYKTVQRMRG
jgi:hypothetical protein